MKLAQANSIQVEVAIGHMQHSIRSYSSLIIMRAQLPGSVPELTWIRKCHLAFDLHF